MKSLRINKGTKAIKRIRVLPGTVVDRTELDKNVFDMVLKTLFENSDKQSLHLESEIFNPHNVMLPQRESDRIWNVLIGSGWVSPAVGFGNAGKLELTKAGYQLMSQFGGYKEYMEFMQKNQQQPQTIILPIALQEGLEIEQGDQPPQNPKQLIKKIKK